MRRYTATHEIYDDGGLKYLYDVRNDAVLCLNGRYYCSMHKRFSLMVEGVTKNDSEYKFKLIHIDLENK